MLFWNAAGAQAVSKEASALRCISPRSCLRRLARGFNFGVLTAVTDGVLGYGRIFAFGGAFLGEALRSFHKVRCLKLAFAQQEGHTRAL